MNIDPVQERAGKTLEIARHGNRSAAGDLVDPKAGPGAKVKALLRAAAYYTWWYPTRWLGWGRWPRYAEFGRLATHMRYVNRASRRLARTIFHAMVRFGPKLEKRQAVLARIVDISAELFAIAATNARAVGLVSEHPFLDAGPIEAADLFSRQSRRRVEALFHQVFTNEDVVTCQLAQDVLKGAHRWIEEGLPQM